MRLWFKGNYGMIRENLCLVDWDAEFEFLSVEDCYDRLGVVGTVSVRVCSLGGGW